MDALNTKQSEAAQLQSTHHLESCKRSSCLAAPHGHGLARPESSPLIMMIQMVTMVSSTLISLNSVKLAGLVGTTLMDRDSMPKSVTYWILALIFVNLSLKNSAKPSADVLVFSCIPFLRAFVHKEYYGMLLYTRSDRHLTGYGGTGARAGTCCVRQRWP